MRITCNACNAQYNLPDEKVRGRRVKVRCKRCSEGIVVDGTQLDMPAPEDFEDEATRVMDSPVAATADKMWTVNLSEEQQGDMTDEEMTAAWQAGILTEDAYVWREGMDDWAALLDVPEIVSMLAQVQRVQPQAATAAEAEPPTAEPPAPPPVASPSAPSPPPASPSLPASPLSPGPQRAASPPTPQLPTPPPMAPALGNGPSAARRSGAAQQYANLFEAAPRREPPKIRASTAREENSVLFSLDALKAAATSGPNLPEAPASTGRISEDLLMMGGPSLRPSDQAPLIQVEVPAAVAQARAASSIPAAPLSFPGSVPAAPRQGGKGVIVAVVLTAVLVGGGVFAAQQFLSDAPSQASNDTSSAASGVASTSAQAPATASAATSAEPVASAAASGSASAEPEEEETPSSDESDESSQRSSRRTPSSGRASSGSSKSSGSSGSGRDTEEDQPSKGEDKPSKDSSGGVKPEEVDLGGATESGFSTAAAKASLSAAAANAKSCAQPGGASGSGKVQVTFVPSGRVTSANVVSGPFGGTPVGGCVARTFRSARVPKFSGAPVTVAKSFNIPKKD